MGKPGTKKASGGGANLPGGKRFFPSKAKKEGIGQWIPEAKEFLPKRINKKDFRSKQRSGSAKDLICLFCRKTGHTMKRCPENKVKGARSSGTLCYKCGARDHSVWDCPAEAEAGEAGQFAFASCFVCGEKGHISRECPKNSKGIYVNGGSCKLCKGVDHLIKDCPHLDESRRAGPPSRAAPSSILGESNGKHVQWRGGDDLEDDFTQNISDTDQPDMDDNNIRPESVVPQETKSKERKGKGKEKGKVVKVVKF